MNALLIFVGLLGMCLASVWALIEVIEGTLKAMVLALIIAALGAATMIVGLTGAIRDDRTNFEEKCLSAGGQVKDLVTRDKRVCVDPEGNEL